VRASRTGFAAEGVVRLAPEGRKSNAGRKPFDAVTMFKVLVLQTLCNWPMSKSNTRSATGSRSCVFWTSACDSRARRRQSVGAEALERDERVERLQRITLGAERLQALVEIVEPQLTHGIPLGRSSGNSRI
jgi:hypothetical protein